MEEINQRLHQEIVEHRQTAMELHHAKNQFLANMSHELRTPLTVILGLAGLMQQHVYGPLTDKQADALQKIEKSGRHLLSLIEEILDFSSIKKEDIELSFDIVTIETICEASIASIRPLAEKKALDVNYHRIPDISLLRGDGERLRQVLVHLLKNAVKFTPEGGAIGLDVTGDSTERLAHLTVWDNGIGIAEQDKVKLFQPFYQLDNSSSRKYKGTGLGLAIVSHLVKLHGGEITVESQPGQGSRFTVTLPYIIADN